MDNRYRSSGGRQDRDRYGSRNRQDEQFSSSDDQYGEPGWRTQENERWQSGMDYDRGYGRNEPRGGSGWPRPLGSYRGDTQSFDDYDQSYGGSTYDRQGRERQSSGRSGGVYGDYGRSARGGGYEPERFGFSASGSGSYGSAAYGSSNYGSSDYGSGGYDQQRRGGAASDYGANAPRGGGHIPPRQYDPDERGFFDRASDAVMSWFGDDDAARRRQMDARADHRGKGPAGYTRSKERILEDANERLMHDSSVDASRINVTCEDNEITLTGTVDSRSAKRRAEDIVENISGVKHVQNNLRVETRDSYYGETGSSMSGSASGNSGTSGAAGASSGGAGTSTTKTQA